MTRLWRVCFACAVFVLLFLARGSLLRGPGEETPRPAAPPAPVLACLTQSAAAQDTVPARDCGGSTDPHRYAAWRTDTAAQPLPQPVRTDANGWPVEQQTWCMAAWSCWAPEGKPG